MFNRLSFRSLFTVLGLIGSLIWLAVFSFPDNKLHLVFCDVGQGDAILVSKGFDQILVDAGPNEKVLNCLSKNMPFFDKTIEIVALTHPEADHLTGIIPVMDKYQVDYFLTGPEGNNSAAFAALESRIKNLESRIKIINPYTGEKIQLGEIQMQTLWPEREWVAEKLEAGSVVEDFLALSPSNTLGINSVEGSPRQDERRLKPAITTDSGAVLGAQTSHSKLNDFSLVFLLEYKNFSVLLMGDADSRIQNEIINAESNQLSAVSNIDILKFPHHGSKTGIREDFLQKIAPKEAVISVGKNSYGHPTSEALDLLQKYGIKTRRTDEEGDIKYQF